MPERHVTTDHDEIRAWVEERGGCPARVKGTGGRRGPDDIGMIRVDFPGFSGQTSLERVEWDDWFRAFDENNLALLIEIGDRDGNPSRFNKIIGRDTAERRAKGDHRAARRKK